MIAPPVLVRSDDFVVLDKPAGLAVHPGPRGGPSVEDWFKLLSRRRTGPWLAHRLDADTAGCLVVALRRAALQAAQSAFADGRAGKTYWAAVAGRPEGEGGLIDAPLLKRSAPAGWRVQVDPAGKAARTRWRLLGSAQGASWLELHPETGRTHQVRVHCAALGCPVYGDPVYGDPVYGDGQGRLQLLARAIALPLGPETGAGSMGPQRRLDATAPVPGHMRDVLRALGWCGEDAPPRNGAPS